MHHTITSVEANRRNHTDLQFDADYASTVSDKMRQEPIGIYVDSAIRGADFQGVHGRSIDPETIAELLYEKEAYDAWLDHFED